MQLKGHGLIKIVLLFTIIFFLFNVIFSTTSTIVSGEPETPPPEASLNPIVDTDYVISEPGRTATYRLLLKNEGERGETFLLNIRTDVDWEIKVEQQRVSLDSGETKEILVTIKIPQTLYEDRYWFNITVTSRSIQAVQTTVHMVASSKEVIITARMKPILVIAHSKDQLGTIKPGDSVEIDLEVKCYLVSTEVYLEYEVYKKIGVRDLLENNLTISISPERKVIRSGSSSVFTLTIEFPERSHKPLNHSCRISVQPMSLDGDAISRPVTLNFLMVNKGEEGIEDDLFGNPFVLGGIITMISFFAVGSAIASTEIGKYKFLTLLFIPLYTKLHKSKILDHFTRGRVYEYVRNNPGVHYSHIKRELELNNGSLAYHLHTLEREALIRSQTKGRFKVFYPTGVKIPKDMEPQISNIRKQLLDIIRNEPGISQKVLGLRFEDKTQRTISYHVKTMAREGVLRLEKDGRENKCYINDEAIEVQPVGSSEIPADTKSYEKKYIDKETMFRQI